MASLRDSVPVLPRSVRRDYQRRIERARDELYRTLDTLDGLIRDMREDHPKASEEARSFLALGRARLHDSLDSFREAKAYLR